jgi:putative transposase
MTTARLGTQTKLPLRGLWGGRRPGAGRPRLPRRTAVAHRSRPPHKSRFPVHLTLRACRGLPSLRAGRVFESVRGSIAASSRRGFRVVHFSVQGDHLHLMVEARDNDALSSGARGLSVRIARAVNRTLGRHGRVWGDRYHTRALTTPREVRNGLVYVLMNVKKHRPGWRGLDPCSSAGWFDGFRDARPPAGPDPPPVQPPRTWLAAHGWRRHGLVTTSETPRI